MVSPQRRWTLAPFCMALSAGVLFVHVCVSAEVAKLTLDSFDSFVESNERALVFFYAPWCGHCQRLHPEFEKAAEKIEEDGLLAVFGTVDATLERDLASRYSVQTYPSLRYFLNGQDYDYTGGRNVDQLSSWVSQRESPDFNWTQLLLDRQKREVAVSHLTSANFDGFVKKYQRVLVMFWAEWCDHCHSMKPEFEKAAVEMQKISDKTGMAMVQETDLGLITRYNIEKYPYLKYIDSATGTGVDTPDVRQAHQLLGFIKSAETRQLQFLQGDVDVAAWIESNTTDDQKFVVVMTTIEGSNRLKQLNKVQFSLVTQSGFSFVASVVDRSAGLKQPSSLMMHRKGFTSPDSEVVHYDGQWTVDALRAWVVQHSYPTIGMFDEDREKYRPGTLNSEKHLKGSLFICLDDEDDDDGFLSVREVLTTSMAKRNEFLRQKGIYMAWADAGDDFTRSILGIDESLEPQLTLLTFDFNRLTKYILRGRDLIRDEAAVSEFIDGYFDGSTRAQFLSQPFQSTEPEDNGIVTLVGDTFAQVALDPGQNVFVKFFQSTGGAIDTAWEDLAALAKEKGLLEQGVVIAQMNAVANECEETFESYPKLVFYPAVKTGRKKAPGIEYKSKDMNAQALLKFLMRKAVFVKKVEVKKITTSTATTTTTLLKAEPAQEAFLKQFSQGGSGSGVQGQDGILVNASKLDRYPIDGSYEEQQFKDDVNMLKEVLPKLSDTELSHEAMKLTKKLEDARAVLGFLKQSLKEKEAEFITLQVEQAELRKEQSKRKSEL